MTYEEALDIYKTNSSPYWSVLIEYELYKLGLRDENLCFNSVIDYPPEFQKIATKVIDYANSLFRIAY